MGYFNYFIKCIIRNIAYRLCKPKVFLTVLLSICVLFGLKHYGFCALSDLDYEMIADGFSTITSNQGTLISQLSIIGVDVTQISDELRNINLDIEALKGTVSNIDDNLLTLLNKVNSLNNNIINIYNRLDSNQRELLSTLNTNHNNLIIELQEENKKVLDELQLIREAINGTQQESSTFTDLGIVINNENSVFMKFLSIDYEPRYTYTVKLYYTNPHPNSYAVFSYASDNMIPQNFNYYDYANDLYYVTTIPANSTNYVVTYNVPQISSNPKYIGFTWGLDVQKIEVFRSINGIVENLNESNSLQQQQNQLQQEQNQLQQEQNDFLKQESSDSDVSVDGFNSVDSNDITSSGLSGIFTNIYNSISNWSSKDINLPIPYTNTNITIPANYTYNMLNSFGGGWIITFISSIYYFIVARFIIYSITSIINSIKSGSILETDSKNNITTDML